MMIVRGKNMLALTPEHEKQIAQFREALRLPDQGYSLRDAEAAHEKAKAELDAVAARRAAAHQALHDGQFKSHRITADRERELKAEIAALDDEFKALATAERAAMAEVQKHRAEYQAEVHRLLAPACRSLTAAIDDKLAGAQELFALADTVRAEGRRNGIEIDTGLLVDGKQRSKLVGQVRATFAKVNAG